MSNPLSAPVRPTPSLPASARPTVFARPAERHSISDGVVAPLDHQRPSIARVPVEIDDEIDDAIAELCVGDDTGCVELPGTKPTVMYATVEPSAAVTTAMPVASDPSAAVTTAMPVASGPSAAVTTRFLAHGSASTATHVRPRIPSHGIAVSAPRPAARVIFPAVPVAAITPAMYPIVPSTAPIAARLPLPPPTPSRGVAAQSSIPPANGPSNLVNTSMRTLGAAGHTPMNAARVERRNYAAIDAHAAHSSAANGAPTTPMRAPVDAKTVHLVDGTSRATHASRVLVDAKSSTHGSPSTGMPADGTSCSANWFAAGERSHRVTPVGSTRCPSTQHAHERRLAWLYLLAGVLMPLLAPIGWVHAEEQVERFSDRLFRIERIAGLVLTLVAVSVLACGATILIVRQ